MRPADSPEFVEEYERYRGDRAQLLFLADRTGHTFRNLGPRGFMGWVAGTAPDRTAAANVIALQQWHHFGLQSVELSHKLAAALMATSAVGALDHARLPWPAFEIRVPPGLLESSHGDVYSCIVHRRPDWMPAMFRREGEEHETADTFVLYYDARTMGHVGLSSLADIARFEPDDLKPTELGMMRPILAAEFEQSKENRVKQLLMRLITGVILLITEARIDKPQVFPQHPLRPDKHGKPRANTHRVVRPVTIDVTASIRDFVRGIGRDSPHVTTLVRGHWRQQAYGPKHSLRRPKWIEPFWRGDGPIQVRPTQLRDEP